MADEERNVLSGWGLTAPTAARVIRPSTEEEAAQAVEQASDRGLIARGLGRSYGDAAQNAGGDVLVATDLNRILRLDLRRGRARVQAGVSLDWLMRTLVPLGFFPMVTPGTRQVTVGGAIASDIHGKNHHFEGSFCTHVENLLLDTPAVGPIAVSPREDPDIFWATAGGMGLTGVILEATIRLLPIQTSRMRVDTERLADLDSVMARMLDSDDKYRYSMAWIDSLARGRALGRAILLRGDHARLDDLPAPDRTPEKALAFTSNTRLTAPPWAPTGLLNRHTVGVFNELWFRKAPKHEEGRLESISAFFHPLDIVAGWNRIYGRRGFVQYQVLVPYGREDALRTVLEQLSNARCASFLTVLKRFGEGNPAPLSFPQPGWTLALDIPASSPDLGSLLDRLDDVVAGAGGRVYLAKDSRLRPQLLPVMYPDLPRWQKVRHELDPHRRMQSDLSRRLWTLIGEDH
jgi:decaprenylphospho-beta-D-ribofuranose 2-oxidase